MHGLAFADFRFPVGVHFGQVVGEDKGRARAVGTAYRRDILRRQFHAGIEIGNRFVVPLAYFAEIDVAQHLACQTHVTGFDARQINHRHHAADHRGKLDQTLFFKLFRAERRIRGAEIHGLGGNLADAAAGADGLIIHFYAGSLLIGFSPFGVNGRWKCGAGAGDFLTKRRSGAGSAQCQCGNRRRREPNGFKHMVLPRMGY